MSRAGGARAGVGAAVAAVLLLGACSGGTALPLAGSRPGEPAGVTGWPGPTSGEHLLTSDGRLYAEDLDDGSGVCFWFVSGSGTVVSLRWPAGWSAQAGPLAVRDPDGRVVARLYDEGLGVVGHYEAGRTGCAPGGLSRSFAVTRVQTPTAG